MTVLPGPTARGAGAVGGAPRLAVATAPVGRVQAADLPPPPGVRQEPGRIAAMPRHAGRGARCPGGAA